MGSKPTSSAMMYILILYDIDHKVKQTYIFGNEEDAGRAGLSTLFNAGCADYRIEPICGNWIKIQGV